MYELHTLTEVIQEIKDEATRQYIENLPFDLKISPQGAIIEEGDLKLVEKFAKETGDFTYLSRVDMLVMAAGVSLARKKGEYDQIKKEPPSIEEFRPKRFQEYYEDTGANDDGSEEGSQESGDD